jgi:hypothetical protein
LAGALADLFGRHARKALQLDAIEHGLMHLAFQLLVRGAHHAGLRIRRVRWVAQRLDALRGNLLTKRHDGPLWSYIISSFGGA